MVKNKKNQSCSKLPKMARKLAENDFWIGKMWENIDLKILPTHPRMPCIPVGSVEISLNIKVEIKLWYPIQPFSFLSKNLIHFYSPDTTCTSGTSASTLTSYKTLAFNIKNGDNFFILKHHQHILRVAYHSFIQCSSNRYFCAK